jgi:hypothetical protein
MTVRELYTPTGDCVKVTGVGYAPHGELNVRGVKQDKQISSSTTYLQLVSSVMMPHLLRTKYMCGKFMGIQPKGHCSQ